MIRKLRDALNALAVNVAVIGVLALGYMIFNYSIWFALVPVLLWLFGTLGGRLRRSYKLRTNGYTIWPMGNGRCQYQELRNGELTTIDLPSEWTSPGCTELFVPTASDWDNNAPPWAVGRRTEIFEKVIFEWRGSTVHYPKDWDGRDAEQ